MVIPAFSDCVSKLGVDENDVIPFGRNKAKIPLKVLDKTATPAKLILVSAITPTPSGEGKTTVSIGLAQGLQAIGKKACLALRQPSMGPVFGRKGGATGGGQSSLTPMEEINMHFTGDFHAITSAHNLISAIIDNAMFFHTLNIDERKVTWKRVMDMNDRALRSIIVGLNRQGFRGKQGSTSPRLLKSWHACAWLRPTRTWRIASTASLSASRRTTNPFSPRNWALPAPSWPC